MAERDNIAGILRHFERVASRVAGDLDPADERPGGVEDLYIDRFTPVVVAGLNSFHIIRANGGARPLDPDHQFRSSEKVEFLILSFPAAVVSVSGRRGYFAVLSYMLFSDEPSLIIVAVSHLIAKRTRRVIGPGRYQLTRTGVVVDSAPLRPVRVANNSLS